MKIPRWFRTRRWQALLMLALVLSMPAAALTYGIGGATWSDLRSGTLEPEGWPGGPLEDLLADPMNGDDALLRMLEHVGAMPETAQLPVQSHVLGLAAMPQALPAMYEARAVSSSTPLRDALLAYNAALKLADEDDLAAELLLADEMAPDAQAAIAVLLYALADASLLQKDAVSGLSDEDYTALLGLPGMILSGRLDPTDASAQADEDFAEAYRLLSQVDKQRIDEAALITAHTVSHALPTLREWSARERAAADDPRIQAIEDLVRPYGAAAVEAMEPAQRLDILADALRTASTMQGTDIHPATRPLPAPSGETPLRDAILELSQVLEQVDANALESELRRADALPTSLQTAVARIVTNQADLLRASLAMQEAVAEAGLDATEDPQAADLSDTDQQLILDALGDVRHAELRVVRAVQESAPTLEAWGLVWSRESSMLPASSADAGGKLTDAAALGAGMANPETGLQQVLRLAAHARGTDSEAAAEPPLPPRGALGDAVLRLYTRYGIEVDDATRRDVRDGAEALPPIVEQNTARILLAQLDALDDLEDLQRSLSDQDHEALATGTRLTDRLTAGQPFDAHDTQALRAHYAVRDRVEATYVGAATRVAAALDAAVQDLEAPPAEEDEDKPWYSGVLSFIPTFEIIPTAKAQSIPSDPSDLSQLKEFPCPESPLADCENDVWFMDPLLETVVVSGFGETTFSAKEMGVGRLEPTQGNLIEAVYTRGQMLTLDLGGDDAYQNNAGGASPALTHTEFINLFFAHPTGVSMALDLAGDDEYLPLDGLPYDEMWYIDNDDNNVTISPSGGTQGAAVGGIGLLWDRRGADEYTADVQAQGFGGSTSAGAFNPGGGGFLGLGILLDGDGEDSYVAKTHAQGSAQGTAIGALVDLAGNSGLGGDDEYTLTGDDAVGQGGASGTGALGILVDSAGSDDYAGGSQGSGANGVGILIDLAGDDDYTRNPNETFRDGVCWTTMRAPRGDAVNDPEGFRNNASGTSTGGIFIDLDGGLCTVDIDRMTPDIPDLQRFLDDKSRDVDGDGYPDWVEEEAGTNTTDANEYPAGLPREAPPGWPEGTEYPPTADGRALPHGSDVLLRIPLVILLADSVDNVHEGDCRTGFGEFDSELLGLLEYSKCWNAVWIELGGDDDYKGQVTGPGFMGRTLLGSLIISGTRLLVDVQGDDDYLEAQATCVQGCGTIHIDLQGNDTYVAKADAQGVATIASPRGVFFDGDGHDDYQVTSRDAEALAQGGQKGSNGFALFIDAAGDDMYDAPSQGTTTRQGVGWFMDFGGNDQYQPAGRQGVATEGVAAFIDAGGDDAYVGTANNPQGPDRSHHFNDRFNVDADTSPSLAVFWDVARDPLQKAQDVAAAARDPDNDSPAAFRSATLGIAVGTIGSDAVGAPYSLYIDPGGDDTYTNNAGGTLFRIDQRVDADAQSTGVTYNPATNYPLAAIHLDFDGDDLYTSADLASLLPGLPTPRLEGFLVQGAGFLGTGILVDDADDPEPGAGADTYVARGMAQGFGLYGWGVLWDRVGDDTYWYDPVVVRDPVVDGDFSGWLEVQAGVDALLDPTGATVPGASAGTWTMKARGVDWIRDCQLRVPGQAGPFDGLTISRDKSQYRIAFSALDQTTGLWSLYQATTIDEAKEVGDVCKGVFTDGIIDLDASKHGLRRVEHGNAQDPLSNEINAQFATLASKDLVLWQDDRDGMWSLYTKPLSGATQDLATGLGGGELGTHVASSSNQTDPDVDGNWVVYVDDRPIDGCPEDSTGIYRFQAASGIEQRLSKDCGLHARPQADGGVVVWQVLGSSDWDVMVHLPTDKPGDARMVTGDGDQYGPTVSQGTILYTDASEDEPNIVRYDLATDQHHKVRSGAIQPALDAQASYRTIWVDINGRGPQPGADVGSAYYEVHRRDLGSQEDPDQAGRRLSMMAEALTSPWMQGASFVFGQGILFDETGSDVRHGDRFAQGVGASLVGPKQNLAPELNPTTQISAFGILVDLDGNDPYTARQESQGVHWAREFGAYVPQVPTPAAPTPDPLNVEISIGIGLLLDFRGNDAYAANRNSQGYGALTVGGGINLGTWCSIVTGIPFPLPCIPANAFLVQSYGLFLDLGGLDSYAYQQEMYARYSVQDDFCATVDAAAVDPIVESTNGMDDTIRSVLTQLSSVSIQNDRLGVDETIEIYDFEALYDDTLGQDLSDVDPGLPEQTALEFVEETITSVTGPFSDTCRFAEEIALDQRDNAIQTATNEPPVQKDRNNEAWRQKPRNDAIDNLPLSCGPSCPHPIVVGGIGMDLPLLDNLNAALMTIANEIIDTELKVTTLGKGKCLDGGKVIPPGTEPAKLCGAIEIVAEATFNQSLGLTFDGAEFFAGPPQALDLLGDHFEFTQSPSGWTFQRPWDTDQDAHPDGEYGLRARIHYKHPAFGPRLGYAQEDVPYHIDNVPRIGQEILSDGTPRPFVSDGLDPSRALSGFSPFPYAGNANVPGLPVVSFTVSKDPFVHDAHGSGTDRVDAWATIDILDQAGQVMHNLMDGTVDASAPVQATWDGLLPDGSLAPAALYTIRVEVSDRDPAEDERTRRLQIPIAVYPNTPTSCVHASPSASCDQDRTLNLASGSRDAFGDLAVRLELTGQGERGTAPPGLEQVERYYLRVGDGPVGDIVWQDPVDLGAGVKSSILKVKDGETRHVVALAQDRAGNLECAPVCPDQDVVQTDDTVPRGFDIAYLEAAFDRKIALGRLATIKADLNPPAIQDLLVQVDGETMPSSGRPRLGESSAVTIQYQIIDETSQPTPMITWTPAGAPELAVTHETTPFVSQVQDATDARLYDVTWGASSGWPDMVGPLGNIGSWPEGVVTVNLNAADGAGNPVPTRSQISKDFLLDRTPPVVEDVRRVYPDGRTFAKEGDDVILLVTVSDPELLSLQTPARDLTLDIDASSITVAPSDDACQIAFTPGLCYLAQQNAWRTVIPIDTTGMSGMDGLRAARFDVLITVTDVAGNTHQEPVEIVLGSPELVPQQDTQKIGIYDIETAWTTQRTAEAYLRMGPSADDLGDPIPATSDVGGTLHAFTIDDLDPGTRYVYRFFAVDPESRALEAGPITSFATLHGVGMSLTSPDPNASGHQIVSGLYRIEGSGWVQEARDDAELTIEPRVVMTLFGPGLPESGRVVFDGSTDAEAFRMDLVTDALEDGLYTLNVTTSYLQEDVTQIVEGLLIDNTAPTLKIIEPIDESILAKAPQQILVRVEEWLTPLDEASVTLRIDDRIIAFDSVEFNPDRDAEHGVLEITGWPHLRPGIHRIEVFAQDAAGNPGYVNGRFLYDPDAPALQARLDYPTDQEAARPGQWVRLEAEVSDRSGVNTVTADTTTLGGSITAMTGDTDHHQLEVPIPADLPEGVYEITLAVRDHVGNIRNATVPVAIDATPPLVLAIEPIVATPTSAMIQVSTSEPVSVVAEAISEGSTPRRAIATDRATAHTLSLQDLQAGDTYALSVSAVDRAGHVANTEMTWSFRPDLGTAPPVEGLNATAIKDEIRLAWEDVGAGFRYAIHRASNGSFETLAVASMPSYADQDIEPGKLYRYFVQALDAQERHGPASNVVEAVASRLATAVDEEQVIAVYPTQGVADHTSFVFTATLRNADAASPSVWLVLEDGSRRMTKDPTEDCRRSCTFRHATTLPAIELRDPTIDYHVEVFSASGVTRLPSIGSMEGPSVIAPDEGLAGTPERGAPAPTILIVLLALVVAAITIQKRRDP